MEPNLTWNDLILQNIEPKELQRWLRGWSDWIPDQVAPLFLSRFGDWFLRHADGRTSELSVIEGFCQVIAPTPEAFEALVNDPEWQEEHLLAGWVQALHASGKVPGPGEGYGFTQHPKVVGRLVFDEVEVMPMGQWQAACVQVFL